MATSTAVAASLATLKTIEQENLLRNVMDQGRTIRAMLKSSLESHPNVGDIRGRGLFIGVEFVADRETREPIDVSLKMHNVVQRRAFANGLMVYGMGGTIDGRVGDHVLIAPPYIIDDEQAEELVAKLTDAINDALPADQAP